MLIQTVDDGHYTPAVIDAVIERRAKGQAVPVATDLASGASTIVDTADGDAFLNRYPPPLRMMIVGAVHVSQNLVPLARQLGYRVLVVDPRDSFAAASRFTDLTVDTRWPDEAFAEWKPDGGTAVITLTHDPKIDDPALAAALGSNAFYGFLVYPIYKGLGKGSLLSE